MILPGDLNCNLLGNCPDGQALIDLCSTLNLFQLVEKPTRVTETSQTLIDVIYNSLYSGLLHFFEVLLQAKQTSAVNFSHL